MSRTRRCIGLVVLAFAACSDAQPRRYVTEYLDVEPSDDEVICAGTLVAMDSQMERIAKVLGVELPAMTHVYYGHSAVEDHCGAGPIGCTNVNGVFAASDSIFHELVHAVRRHQAGGVAGTWLFEEGLAQVLSGFRWDPYTAYRPPDGLERRPAVLADFPRGQDKFVPEDYSTAGHFVSWLRTTHGDATLVAFLNDERYLGGEAYDEAFTSHFGLSIDEADSAWREAAAEEYSWSEVCDPAFTLEWEGSTLEFTDTVDCEAPHTTGPREYGFVTLRSHCFTVAQQGRLRVEFIAGGGRIRLSPVDCVDTGEFAPESYDYKSLKGGDTEDLPFAACTWEVQVDGVAGLQREFMLRMTRL